MSNCIAIDKSLVEFTPDELDIPGLVSTIKVGELLYLELQKNPNAVIGDQIARLLSDNHVTIQNLCRALYDSSRYFASVRGERLPFDFYPGTYKDPITIDTFVFVLNHVVRPFVRRPKKHTFRIADLHEICVDRCEH